MSKKPLTEKQKEVLEFIREFIKQNGQSPDWGHISERFGTGTTNVRRYIGFLVKKGHVEKDNSTRPPSLKII
jgi:hypothetical protein